MKKSVAFLLVLVMLLGSLCSCNDINEDANMPSDETTVPDYEDKPSDDENLEKYNAALALLQQERLEEAYTIFLTLQDYKDVSDYLSRFVFHLEKQESNSQYGDYTAFYAYDDYGRRTFQETVYADESKSYRTNYRYDENGFLIEVERTLGYLAGITRYEYDEAGNPIRQIEPSGETVELEYDKYGNITKVVGLGYIQERKFDASGRMTENVLKNESGFWMETKVYEYNEHGELIKTTVHENGGAFFTQSDCQFEYDEQGNKIRCIWNQASGMGWDREEWEYDAEGNLIQNTIYASNGEFVAFYFEYDESGNKIERRCEDGTGITSYVYYEYDVYGNVLKRTMVEQDPAIEDDIAVYTYRLCYKPDLISLGEDPTLELPEEMVGRG
ncbi:MAG: RHS repeat protein [Clostridia bacterium]|nr:RHS repeat protein [Clostridia bacterium]